MPKILLVDDNENNLLAIENILKRLTVEIVKATNGNNALRATLNQDFALAIIDVQMPAMDGYELAQLLRSDDKTKNIPIIFLTAAYSDELHVFKGYESGAVDFITKPFNADILLSKVAIFIEIHKQKMELLREKVKLETLILQLEEEIRDRQRAEAEKAVLEARLRQAQKMEAIGTLAGGIAHDFNNLLAIILGYTEIAQLDIPELSPLHYHLGQVLQAGRRAQDLVRQILVFSRMKQGQERVPVRISSLIRESLNFLRATLPTTIEIQNEIGYESGMVLADSTQLHQVLVNLCTNAAHAMEERGGVLKITLTDVDHLSEMPPLSININPGAYLKISVSDTGHGMDADTLERIFDPYFTTKAVGKGTGLGLAIVHGIVNQHDGTISVHSEPGKGTKFDIFLPRLQTDFMPDAFSDAILPSGTGRLLFVDDEEMLVNVIKLA